MPVLCLLCDQLTFLPEMIGDLSSLVYLNVNNCSLRELPDSVCDLRNLIRLGSSVGKDGSLEA